ncbi:MAG: S1C family serine protease, partial [Persicimonas sp.]
MLALSVLVAVPMLWDAGGVQAPPLSSTEASAEPKAGSDAQASAGQQASPSRVQPPPTSLPNVSRVFEQQKEKVVAIKAEIDANKSKQMRGHPFSGQMPNRPRTGRGSGFIVDEDGYIITNHHVVGDAAAISVILQSGESYPAEVVGSDPSTDIALLKV